MKRMQGLIRFGGKELRITNHQLRSVIDGAFEDAQRVVRELGTLTMNAAYSDNVQDWRMREIYGRICASNDRVDFMNKLIVRFGLGDPLVLDVE